jgi:RNA polymerase sigma-70 factor (sigma-E family)
MRVRAKRTSTVAHLGGVSAGEDVLTSETARRRARLEDLYERHVGRAVMLARLLTGDPQGAEDIAHDAFIRVAGRFAHLRDEGSFDVYYRRAVVNLCRARFRRARVEREYLRRAPMPGQAERTPEPEERDRLWSVVRELPERQRTAIVLRYYEDLSEDETARVLHCSARAVNSLVSRAMTQLRSAIQEEERR